jgi:hypothetical protein
MTSEVQPIKLRDIEIITADLPDGIPGAFATRRGRRILVLPRAAAELIAVIKALPAAIGDYDPAACTSWISGPGLGPAAGACTLPGTAAGSAG